MSGMFNTQTAVPGTLTELLAGMQIGTSAYNTPVPVVFGRQRVAGNIIWMPNAFWTKTTSSGGKFGGGKGGSSSGSTSDSYFQGVGIALCEGVVQGINQVWVDKSVYKSLYQINTNGLNNVFTLFNGDMNQGPWSYFNGAIQQKSAAQFPAAHNYLLEDPGFIQIYSTLSSGTSMMDGVMNVSKNAIQVYYNSVWSYLRRSDEIGDGKTGRPPVAPELGDGFYYTIRMTGQGPVLDFISPGDVLMGCLVQFTYQGTESYAPYALSYQGTAYVITPSLALGSSNSMPNITWEVIAPLDDGSGWGADPASAIVQLLTNQIYGCNWDPSQVEVDIGADGTAASSYRTYCAAMNFKVAPIIDQQKPVLDHVQDILNSTNSIMAWSNGQLRIVPLGDTAVGNYAPAMTPVYDITPDFLLPLGTTGGKEMAAIQDGPIEVTRKRTFDSFNQTFVEYLDCGNNYDAQVVSYVEQADLEQTKLLRPDSTQQLHAVINAPQALVLARLRAQRSCYVRNTYRFKVGMKHALLEPSDLVTLSDPKLGLYRKLVRILSVEEDPVAQEITIEAEEVPVGIAHAAAYTTQAGEGDYPNLSAQPSFSLQPAIFLLPADATASGKVEVWIGTASSDKNWGGSQVWLSWDGVSYENVGDLTVEATYGMTTGAVPAGPSDDETTVIGVDVSMTEGVLDSVSATDRDALLTACWLDGEIFAYANAALQTDGTYQLSSLRRGCRGTVPSAHPAGTWFVKLSPSSAFYSFVVDSTRYGQTLYVKLASYNLARTVVEDVSSVAVSAVPMPNAVVAGATPVIANLPQKYTFEQFASEDWDIYGNPLLSIQTGGLAGGNFLRCTGGATLINKTLIPVNSTSVFEAVATFRQYAAPTSGGGGFTIGFCGVAADGLTLVDVNGGTTLSAQYLYPEATESNSSWYEVMNYILGWSTASPGIATGALLTPGQFHPNVRYVRLMVVMNDPSGNGTVDLDSVSALDATANAAASAASAAQGNRTFYDTVANRVLAATAGAWGGAPLKTGDLWFDTDQEYAAWRWSGTAWLTVADGTPVAVSRITAGSVTGDKLSGNVLQTADYAVDGNNNPTAGAAMVSQTAAPAWSAAVTYAQNAFIVSGGVLYRSLGNGNINNPPATSPGWWQPSASLRVSPSGLQIGSQPISNLWFSNKRMYWCQFGWIRGWSAPQVIYGDGFVTGLSQLPNYQNTGKSVIQLTTGPLPTGWLQSAVVQNLRHVWNVDGTSGGQYVDVDGSNTIRGLSLGAEWVAQASGYINIAFSSTDVTSPCYVGSNEVYYIVNVLFIQYAPNNIY